MANSAVYTVGGFELDKNYRLKSYHIATYFQNTMAYYFAENSVAAYDLQANGKTWVLCEMNIEYSEKLPAWREEVRVTTWTSSCKGFTLIRDFKVTQSDGHTIAWGNSLWLVIDQKTKRPQKLDSLDHKFEVEAGYPDCHLKFRDFEFDEEKFSGPEIPPDKLSPDASHWLLSQYIRSYDIDFNDHVNNIRYIAGALECIPVELREGMQLKSIGVKFSAEAYIHDCIQGACVRLNESGEFAHVLRNQNTGKQICRMKSTWDLIS